MLSPRDRVFLNRSKVTRTYQSGQTVLYQGTPCFGIHCIEEGSVALKRAGPRSSEAITRLHHAGESFGVASYFAGQLYSESAVAIADCRICFIERQFVAELLRRNGDLADRFLRRLAQDLNSNLESLHFRSLPVRTRLCRILLALRDRFGRSNGDGNIAIRLPLSRRDLALMIGVRSESLSRAIRAIEADDVARFSGRTVVIPDLDALLDEVEGDPED